MTQAWIWRSGQRGGFDELALRQQVIVLGLFMVDDLTELGSRDEIRELVVAAFPTTPAARVETMAAQLYSFRHTIAIGDLVVMLSARSNTVAIGEVTGDYTFQPGPGERLHLRPVHWLRDGVEQVAVGADLTRPPANTLIYRLQAADAVARLRAVVEKGKERRRPAPSPRVESPAPRIEPIDDSEPMPAGRPSADLKRNLDYARDLARAGEALRTAGTELQVDVTDVFRAAWVQGCTALEHWVRSEVTHRALTLGRSAHPPEKIRTLAHSGRGDDPLTDAVTRYHGQRSYLQPDAIRRAFSLVARTRTLWTDVAAYLKDETITSPYDDLTVEQSLRQIMARRNAIAHRFDEDPGSPEGRRPLTDREVVAMIDWLERLAAAIADALPFAAPYLPVGAPARGPGPAEEAARL